MGTDARVQALNWESLDFLSLEKKMRLLDVSYELIPWQLSKT